MGYTTQFTGQIELSRELSDKEFELLENFSNDDHRGRDYAPDYGYYCDWVPTRDRKGLEWNGAEKFYSAEEWMQILLDNFITPWGIKANGDILARGEEAGDVWRLLVRDNRVERLNAQMIFAKPTVWGKHIDV